MDTFSLSDTCQRSSFVHLANLCRCTELHQEGAHRKVARGMPVSDNIGNLRLSNGKQKKNRCLGNLEA